ncbi:GL23324 [Drosophila persimilis]|uniref:GL23324 n=1 Tax=Drosophila persimilis TaxID=7234 RepID=B4G4R1_DROPE|nr:GL23324 [Drosophila persimilis]
MEQRELEAAAERLPDLIFSDNDNNHNRRRDNDNHSDNGDFSGWGCGWGSGSGSGIINPLHWQRLVLQSRRSSLCLDQASASFGGATQREHTQLRTTLGSTYPQIQSSALKAPSSS